LCSTPNHCACRDKKALEEKAAKKAAQAQQAQGKK
jgi:hypothetical protein